MLALILLCECISDLNVGIDITVRFDCQPHICYNKACWYVSCENSHHVETLDTRPAIQTQTVVHADVPTSSKPNKLDSSVRNPLKLRDRIDDIPPSNCASVIMYSRTWMDMQIPRMDLEDSLHELYACMRTWKRTLRCERIHI
jgi:hypothetical protein